MFGHLRARTGRLHAVQSLPLLHDLRARVVLVVDEGGKVFEVCRNTVRILSFMSVHQRV